MTAQSGQHVAMTMPADDHWVTSIGERGVDRPPAPPDARVTVLGELVAELAGILQSMGMAPSRAAATELSERLQVLAEQARTI